MGDLSARTDTVHGRGEIGQLAFTFDQMAEALQRRESERLRVENELRKKEKEQERLNSIIELSTDLITILNMNEYGAYLNHSGRKMLGIPEEEDISKVHISNVMPERFYAFVSNEVIPTVIQKGIWKGELALLGPEKQEIPVSVACIGHKSTDGMPEYVSVIAREITELRRMEKALRQSEMAAKQSAGENAAVAEIGRIIGSTLNIEEVYEGFAREVAKLISFDRIVVNTVDAQRIPLPLPTRGD